MENKPAVQINTMEDKELTPTEEIKNEIRNILKSYFPISDFEVGAVNELSKLYSKRIGKAFYVGQNSSDQRVKELSEENKLLSDLANNREAALMKMEVKVFELKEEIDNLKKEREQIKFQLQRIALADDDMIKKEGAAESYRRIVRSLLTSILN